MKRYDLELTATGPVMEERQEGCFVPFSEISGLADTVVRMGDRCTLLSDLLRELRDGIEGEWCFPGDLAERIDAALAGKLPEHAVSVTETIRTAPERIWLQVGDQEHYHSEPFPRDTSEVSWCADSVVGCEVQYVRADLMESVPEGWHVVPEDPTYDMRWAGAAVQVKTHQSEVEWMGDIWRAMISFAPRWDIQKWHEPIRYEVPEGWRMVPVEVVTPTLSWPIEVGVSAFSKAEKAGCSLEDCVQDSLSAMLAAAPKPEG
ncbi:hypothetical protein ACW5XW_08245 [Aeromonas piscicola]|uniref:hypothetical protein n=1 Tax=Aeromonas piscicola TaxID=600645 RepID=UPI0005B42974|nr:hypothetical protein [Aeromonas piscicola]